MQNPKITVIDTIMGGGKTTYMIDKVRALNAENWAHAFDNPDNQRRLIYVAPILSEVDRIQAACPELQFRDPQPVEGRKLWHLETLLLNGENICTTHALFKLLSQDVYRLLRERRYTLVVDEVLDVVQMFNALSRADRDTLFKHQMVYIEDGTRRLRWNHRDHGDYTGRFEDIRALCDNGNLVMYRDTVLIWEFPAEFLRCFEEVYVLTYLFNGSPMSSYLAAEGLPWTQMGIRDGQLVPHAEIDETLIKARLRPLVTVYEGRMNGVGDNGERINPLSSSWFDRALKHYPEQLETLKASTTSFFKHIADTPARDNAWTSFKKVQSKLAGPRYTRGWLPNNLKATNEYRHKKSLAYLCNVFYQPHIRGYFEDRGIPVHQDLFALSEMIQWLWRSQIRDYQPITVFVPSERMRLLLKTWLSSANTAELMKTEIDAFKEAA